MALIPKEPETKRYLNTNRFVTDLPRHFVNSPNKKYIEIVAINLFIDEDFVEDIFEAFEQPKFVSLHADFVQENRELDQHVQFVNCPLTKRKKYQILSRQDKIEIWFTEINGEKLNKEELRLGMDGFYHQTLPNPLPPGPDRHRRIKFVLELLLMY